MSDYLLSLIIFSPLAFSLTIALLPSRWKDRSYGIAVAGSALGLVYAGLLIWSFHVNEAAFHSLEHLSLYEWAPWFQLSLGQWGTLRIDYFIGTDGLNLLLIALSSLLLFIGVISSRSIAQGKRAYFSLYMLLSTAIYGSFLALDFFLFYLFFEFMLLPMYFLIGIWGGKNRLYASIKFFLYTLLGSLFILVVLIGLLLSSNAGHTEVIHTLNVFALSNPNSLLPGSLLDPAQVQTLAGLTFRQWAFLLLMVGFAIKLPAVPFHTWLPDAHVEAPTPISVILAGVLLKVGGYAMLRIALPIFPDVAVQSSHWIAWFGVLSILYGGFAALSQDDIKRMIAYSSISHMGFVLVGISAINTEGITGAVYQMVSHGLLSAALFLIAGVLYDRTGNRLISNFSGISNKMPVYTAFVVAAFFASLGLPGFSGFISELLVLLGAFQNYAEGGLSVWITLGGIAGILLAAGYFLWALQRMFFGPLWLRDKSNESRLVDLNIRELAMLTPLLLFSLLIGIFPRLVLQVVESSATGLVLLLKLIAP